MIALSAADLGRALGGHRSGNGWVCKCVSHDDRNPSLSVCQGDDGRILVRCHAGCDSRDIISELERRGLWPEPTEGDRRKSQRPKPQSKPADDAQRIAQAHRIWSEAGDPRTTPVDAYLAHRGLPPLTADQAGTVFRFSAHCPFGKQHVPALLCRFAPIENDMGDEPTAITRIRLDRFDGPDRRLSLGPAKGQAVKLSGDAEVTLGIGIVEGVEKGLALLASGWAPIWATIGTSTMRTFPTLAGIEALTIFCDRDDPGRDAALACARRWGDAGKETRILQPPAPFKDWDQWWKGEAP